MEPFESHTHAFIIKLWRERRVADAEQFIWRGYIVHVPSQERHYLAELDDIAVYLYPYIDAMGAPHVQAGRLRRWVRRQRAHLLRRRRPRS